MCAAAASGVAVAAAELAAGGPRLVVGGAAAGERLVHVSGLGSYVGAMLEVHAQRRGLATGLALRGNTAPALQPGGPATGVPDMRDHPKNYLGTEVGKVQAEHEYPATEGYRPVDGYFSQSEPCDRMMHMWTEHCAFKEHKDSLYWKGAEKLYPTAKEGKDGKPISTSNYIGNLIAQSAPLSQKFKAADKAK